MKHAVGLRRVCLSGAAFLVSGGMAEQAVAQSSFICRAKNHSIVIDGISSGAPRYRAWVRPGAPPAAPNLELTRGTVEREGTGPCGVTVYSFRSGPFEYRVTNGVGCGPPEEMPEAVAPNGSFEADGSLSVTRNGLEVVTSPCFTVRGLNLYAARSTGAGFPTPANPGGYGQAAPNPVAPEPAPAPQPVSITLSGRARYLVEPGGGCSEDEMLIRGYCFSEAIDHLRRDPKKKDVTVIRVRQNLPIGHRIRQGEFDYIEVKRRDDGTFKADKDLRGTHGVPTPRNCNLQGSGDWGFIVSYAEGRKAAVEFKEYFCLPWR